MANTYYDSDLTGEEIEQALEAIDGVIVPANNGKVLAINNGKIEARSVQWDADLGPKSITENGTYNPASDNLDGYSQVTVNVSGGGGTTDANHVTYNSSETYDSGTVGAALNEQKNTLNQLEAETETVENGLAIIVEGNSCASGASQGQYVYLKDSTITGYADGLYTAAQAIPANTAIDGTYLAAVTGGGLNSLKNSIANLGSTRGTLSAQTSRGSLTAGDAFEFGKLLLINVKFTASVTAANSPNVITVVDVKPAYDSALSCIDITSGISNAIDASQPCGISTIGRIYIKEITANHVYAITGIVKCS